MSATKQIQQESVVRLMALSEKGFSSEEIYSYMPEFGSSGMIRRVIRFAKIVKESQSATKAIESYLSQTTAVGRVSVYSAYVICDAMDKRIAIEKVQDMFADASREKKEEKGADAPAKSEKISDKKPETAANVDLTSIETELKSMTQGMGLIFKQMGFMQSEIKHQTEEITRLLNALSSGIGLLTTSTKAQTDMQNAMMRELVAAINNNTDTLKNKAFSINSYVGGVRK